MTECHVRYRCVVCQVSGGFICDLLRLDRGRSISSQLSEAVWDLHKHYDDVSCRAAELICADTDMQLRDVRFVFLPQYVSGYVRRRQRHISEALAELDWERNGQDVLDRIEASAR